MTDSRREMLVGLFVLAGLVGLGWLVFKFGDLPRWLSTYDTYEISIYFPEAPGIGENSDVNFRGYRVGRVARIHPPTLQADLDNPAQRYYQVIVDVALDMEYAVPATVSPRVCKRGLGGSFIELLLADDRQITTTMLADSDKLKGSVSEASEFISEGTQRRLDNLIGSLTRLSEDLQGQLQPLPPEIVDGAPDKSVRPNLTTAVMRMDNALKNLNKIVGDPANQENFKQGLANIAVLSTQMHDAVAKTQILTREATKFINLTSQTVTNVSELAGQAGATLEQVGAKVQTAADELARALRHLDELLVKITTGQGTAGRMVADPRLYEGLRDVAENLKLAVRDLREMLAYYREHGLASKMKKKVE